MEIKRMTYESVSGGTLTAYVEKNNKLIEKDLKVSHSVSELVKLLANRIGNPVDMIHFQIDSSQHMSEERLIINQSFNMKTLKNDKIILNVKDLDFYEKLRYENVKKDFNL